MVRIEVTWHGLRRLRPVVALSAVVLTFAACSVDLAPLECVDDSTCQPGFACRSGLCRANGLADADGDADAADGAPDAPDDAADAADADGAELDGDVTPGDADATEPDSPDLPDADVADVEPEGPPPFSCPEGVDCLEPTGNDRDGDGTDGQSGQVVLVDPLLGDDGRDGSPSQGPVKTLSRALELVTLAGRTQILLAEGRIILSEPLVVEGPLSFFEIGGGYDPSNWSRGVSRTELRATGPSAIPLLRFDGVGEVRLSQLDVRAPGGRAGVNGGSGDEGPQPEAQAGQTSIAVWAAHSFLDVRDSILQAGAGGDGQRGRLGRIGPDGEVGGNAPEPVDVSRPGGAGAEGPTCFDGEAAPRGGDGGAGDEAGTATDGDPGFGPEGGPGGDRATDPVGQPGGSGDSGALGLGGGPFGYIREGAWHPVPGNPGAPGEAGSGGGGGSSGFDSNGGPSDPGGGGGSGACGGEGGGGGSGGGGSIALYLLDTDALLDDLSVARAGDGGDGGSGGSGGSGGTGHDGGDGLSDGVGEIAGHDGGAGGNGGAGGVGGGGAGGASVAVVLVGTAQLTGGELRFGNGGTGGSRPDAEETPTNAGRPGYAGQLLVFRNLEPDATCRYGAVSRVTGTCSASDGGERTLCLDRYEAVERAVLAPSDPDPDPEDPVGQAIGLPGRLPWRSIGRSDAALACARGGGFLCGGDVLKAACEEGLDDASNCNFASGTLAQTGQSCTSSDGVADLLGNLAEWVGSDCGDTFPEGTLYGGSYLEARPSPPDHCDTTDLAVGPSLEIGFRCCSDPALLQAMEAVEGAE